MKITLIILALAVAQDVAQAQDNYYCLAGLTTNSANGHIGIVTAAPTNGVCYFERGVNGNWSVLATNSIVKGATVAFIDGDPTNAVASYRLRVSGN